MADEKQTPETKGNEGDGKQGGDHKDPVQARIDAEVARRHQAEAKLAALEKAQKEQSEAQLKEQKKFEELYNGAAPKAKLAEELEKSFVEYLALETAELSEEHKALIPEGAPHTQLNWVKKAKAAGVFGKQNQQPDKTFNGKPKGGLPPDKWYLDLKRGDPKIETLTTDQYQEWKQHNGLATSGMRGGF